MRPPPKQEWSHRWIFSLLIFLAIFSTNLHLARVRDWTGRPTPPRWLLAGRRFAVSQQSLKGMEETDGDGWLL